MTQTIKVEPCGKDWKLRSQALDEMTFQSGAAAEAAARLLADATAKSGLGAEVQIYLRDGSLAGCLPYPPKSPSASGQAQATARRVLQFA